MELKIVPYLVFLVLHVLPRMSDFDDSVRQIASLCFATMIRLMPLDSQNDDNAEIWSAFPQELLQQRENSL